jgi:phage-related baseplate assembly protein
MPLNFVEYDSEAIIAELVSQVEEATGETIQPSDERRLFINALAQVIVGINANINDTGNQVLLRTARGETLDALGEFWGVERIGAKTARTTLIFTLSEAQSDTVVIPTGTRATPDGKIYFATTGTLTIAAGSTEGSIEAKCLTDGAIGNGYTAGQVKYIVDNVPFLAGVTNAEETSGGADRESDDSLRDRIRLAPEKLSTAGTIEGYEYYARSASSDVGDVVIYSPANDTALTEAERAAGAGKIFVYILKADGSIPSVSDKVLTDVANVVSAKNVRPLTDFVTVSAPEAITYSIKLSYYISGDNAANVEDIKIAVGRAITEYIAWQDTKIGRNINPDKLRNLILNAGASRVIITTPEYTDVSDRRVAQITGEVIATYEGLSE